MLGALETMRLGIGQNPGRREELEYQWGGNHPKAEANLRSKGTVRSSDGIAKGRDEEKG
jgi:hypothetical protein